MSDNNVFVKVDFEAVSVCTCKNRKSKATIERIDCRMKIDGKPNIRRWFYFVRCRDHKKINGPFNKVSTANREMHNPHGWCLECAKTREG